jgi:hypothetical protein
MEWELLDKPGQPPAQYCLTSHDAVSILKQATDIAKQKGLPWKKDPLPPLKPSPELLKLVRLSQIEATKESAEA